MAQKQFPVQVTRYRNVDYKTSNIYIKNLIIFNLILKFLKSDKNISVVRYTNINVRNRNYFIFLCMTGKYGGENLNIQTFSTNQKRHYCEHNEDNLKP